MHVAMVGGGIIESGAGAYVPDPDIATGPINPLGINFAVGGATKLSYEDFPIFQDMVRGARGFTLASDFGTAVATGANGWPTQDFSVLIHEGGSFQSWVGTTGNGTKFACGFTGVGTVAAYDGSSTVSNIVVTGSGVSQTTTFDFQASGVNYAFKVTGVTPGVEVPSIFCYLPAYRSSQSNVGNVNGWSPTSLFTTEAVAHYKQYGWIRDTEYVGAWVNTTHMTSSNRVTATNFKTQTYPSGRVGYPLDWMVDFIIALNNAGGRTGIYHAWPVDFDVTYMTAEIATLQRLPAGVPIYIELGNELWNAQGGAGGALRALSVAVTPDASFTGTISGTTLTVSGVTGTIVGNSQYTVYGAGVAAGTLITTGSGTSWTVSHSQTVGPVAMTTGSYYSMYRYAMYVWHNTICPALRTAFGSRFGTDVQPVFAVQQGGNGTNFLATGLDYMVAQGWTAGNDLSWAAIAPYMNLTAPVNSWTIAQILTNLTSGGSLSVNSVINTHSSETIFAQARYYGLKGLISYEGCWQVNAEPNTVTNIGASIMDSGMNTLQQAYFAKAFDSGYSGVTRMESGSSSIGGNLGCVLELSNNYATLIGAGSPCFLAMKQYFDGSYVGIKNVISAHGSTFSALNSVDHTGNTYPVFSFTLNYFGPSQNGVVVYMVNCTLAATYSLAIDFTNTAAAAANCKARLDGTIVLSGVGIVPGSGTNGGVNTVTLGAITLSKGYHELTLGPFAYLPTLSMTNLIRFN